MSLNHILKDTFPVSSESRNGVMSDQSLMLALLSSLYSLESITRCELTALKFSSPGPFASNWRYMLDLTSIGLSFLT